MKCLLCNKDHDGNYGSGKFCSSHCAHKYSSSKFTNKYKSVLCDICNNEYTIDKRALPKKYICSKCAILLKSKCEIINNQCSEQCLFYINNFCNKRKSVFLSKLKKLNNFFSINYIGDEVLLYNEIQNIRTTIIEDLNNGLSSTDICKKYAGSSKKGNTIFKNLNIPTRNLKESIINAVLQGKLLINYTPKTKFKTEWHTSWEGKIFYLRSSYEIDYANKLDKNKIPYLVEFLRIKYFDTEKNYYRCAIPDFYLPITNTIVEIKSNYTLNIQQMKDKVKEYLKLGYNFKLILEHNDRTDLFIK